MKKIILAPLFVLLLCVGSLSAFKKNANDERRDDDDKVYFKGWGPISLEDPEGTQLKLPEGVEFIDAIHCTSTLPDGSDNGCVTEDPMFIKAVGTGEQVRLCVSFRNNNTFPVSFVLPPGIMFISKNKKVQNGMLTERVSITLPPQQVYFQPIFMYCANSGRDSSGGGGGTNWRLGPVTNVKPALELLEFIKNKDLHKDRLKTGFLAPAIKEIGSEGKISEFIWSKLAEIPNK